jgi:heavy metal sensor kinase
VNTRSLKFRLVAWYAGWLTALFVVFGIFVYLSLGHYLEKSLREALARRARQVAEMVQRSTLDKSILSSEIPKTFTPEVNNRFTRVVANGLPIYISGLPADRSFNPLAVPFVLGDKEGETSKRRVSRDGRELLIVAITRRVGTNVVIVEEGGSIAPVEATLHAWLAVLILGLALLICVAVLGGAWLVQRALQPVDEITRSAEHITSRNLSERLPVPQTRDEIERLSTALNNMIRRLDEGFQQTQRFFADASHELRTPLTIIQGELEATSKNQELKPDERAAALSTLDEVERLKNIVEGLFALSRLDAGQAQENIAAVNLSELAAITADQMGLMAEDKNISIRCRCAKPVIVQGDRARLKQVLVNLLDNAIKYTPAGGRIDLSVNQDTHHAVLEVTDNGFGIPAEALPHVFDRFFRADRARSREMGGAGLGLSIVKSICAAHRGQVRVYSQEGAGSRFVVELPLAG